MRSDHFVMPIYLFFFLFLTAITAPIAPAAAITAPPITIGRTIPLLPLPVKPLSVILLSVVMLSGESLSGVVLSCEEVCSGISFVSLISAVLAYTASIAYLPSSTVIFTVWLPTERPYL